MAFFAVSGAFAQSGLPPVSPFEPALRENLDTKLCNAFASAWIEVLRSNKDLNADWLDLATAFPEAEIVSFPPEPKWRGHYLGLYDASYHHALDFDGDGDMEVLHIESQDIGWRYLGADLFLFDSQDDYQRAQAKYEKDNPGDSLIIGRLNEPLETPPQRIHHFPPVSVVFLLSIDGSIYVASSPRFHQGGALDAGLIRLNGDQGPQEVCVLDLLPSYETLQVFAEGSELYQAFKSIYGGLDGPICDGTMGWKAPPLVTHFRTIFHRPQVMLGDPHEDAARELRLLVWAVSDPTSWSVYLQLKTSRPAFLKQMANYYERHQSLVLVEARELAEEAYRYLVDHIIYARNPDGYRLTLVAADVTGIDPDSAPSKVADAAIATWLEANPGGPSKSKSFSQSIWRDAVLAALHTRQPPDRIATIWTRFEVEFASQLERGGSEPRKAHIARQRQALLDSMLLAALGEPVLVELVLSLGAEVDSPTNWFNKTPLMYAAQHDNLSSLRLLLSHGANPSSQTNDDGACGELERDQRTALMYAAENASPEVILALLDADADTTGADSMGNKAIWYLERNQDMSEFDRASLRPRLGGSD